MNIFNVAIVLLILLSGVVGLKKGAIKESIVFVGTILVYIISFALKNKVGFILCKWFPFFSFDGIIAINILVYKLIAFAFIASFLFCIIAIVFKLTGVVQKLIDMTVILALPSKILGFVIGLIEGYIVIFLILIIIAIPLRNSEIFNNSSLANKIMYESPVLTKTLGTVPDAILDISKVTLEYQDGKIDKNKINLDIIKIELECDVTNKKEVQELIKINKLKDISGLDQFIKEYQE